MPPTTTALLTRASDARDRIEALIRQQDRFYQCEDYLQVEEEGPVFSPVQLVEECALLVCDHPSAARCESPTPLASSIPRELAAALGSSPTQVNEFRSHGSCSDARPVARSSHSLLSSSRTAPASISCSNRSSAELNSLCAWRHQMLCWAYNVTASYGIDREVVALAFNILDRYLASELSTDECPVEREDFQLYTMVAMYIAIKTLVPYKKLTLGSLLEMSHGYYSQEDVTVLELDVLQALDWRVNPPTVMDFCRLYAEIFPQPLHPSVEHTWHEMAELVLDDVYFVAKPQSLVALGVMLISSHRAGATAKQTQGFLENLQGLVSVETANFESMLRRLESLC